LSQPWRRCGLLSDLFFSPTSGPNALAVTSRHRRRAPAGIRTCMGHRRVGGTERLDLDVKSFVINETRGFAPQSAGSGAKPRWRLREHGRAKVPSRTRMALRSSSLRGCGYSSSGMASVLGAASLESIGSDSPRRRSCRQGTRPQHREPALGQHATQADSILCIMCMNPPSSPS